MYKLIYLLYNFLFRSLFFECNYKPFLFNNQAVYYSKMRSIQIFFISYAMILLHEDFIITSRKIIIPDPNICRTFISLKMFMYNKLCTLTRLKTCKTLKIRLNSNFITNLKIYAIKYKH